MSLIKPSDEYLNIVLDDGLSIREHMEKALKKAIEYERDNPNPKFHRTFEEHNISFEFSQKYKKKIENIEKRIYLSKDNINPKNKLSILLAILVCNKSIYYYNKLKTFCYNNNGQIYFQDRWEYCHNSKNECFEYITSIKELKKQMMKILKNKKG